MNYTQLHTLAVTAAVATRDWYRPETRVTYYTPQYTEFAYTDHAFRAGIDLIQEPDANPDEYYADAILAQYDDDPNPYHGDYSEM